MTTTMQEPFEIKKGTDSGGFILIFGDSDDATYNLVIFGHQGEKIWERSMIRASLSKEILIDLSPVTEGIYVMLIESNRKTWVRKMVVMS